MSTKMTDGDWEIALEVFRLCLPRRGAKAKDGRLFLEALRFFAVHNITWRALPEQFEHWNTVWRRFHRLSRSGVFEDFFRDAGGFEQHGASGSDVRFDRDPRTCIGSRRKRGQQGQALGRSRGGFSTKIHLKTDFDGLLIAFDLTGGEAADSPHFETPIDLGPDVRPRAIVADKGNDSAAIRDGCGRAPGVGGGVRLVP